MYKKDVACVYLYIYLFVASLVTQMVKQCGRPGFDPWVRKIPWRRKWQPAPVLLPGKFHGRRSLVGYSPRDRKESDMTEQLHTHTQNYVKWNITWPQKE